MSTELLGAFVAIGVFVGGIIMTLLMFLIRTTFRNAGRLARIEQKLKLREPSDEL